ncbi:tyrosine-type recombinase/integrase, partial [Bacteroides stercoris]
MTRIKGQLTTADYLPIAEYYRLLQELEKDGLYLWEAYCWLSFCTACRASDVRPLRWKDILGKSAMTRVEQKTKKNRLIKFNRDVQEKNRFLYEMLGRPDPEQYIFLSPRTGKPYSLEYINSLLKTFRVRYRLPIRAFSTHTFRKTFGRYVYELMGRSAEGLILLNQIFR